ncbi:hypothetical protein BDN72DRAFT_855998 [Pluteus cervinus]|uniref:Uncharacterized protein n=1 Tax=Pluteus cervinus TaxID=181527 RepID=A0ACD3B256_9AGAR|nr:hypothetical protein BDN72DRAFT_855998 [Pluteus cervinus]
MPGLTSTTTGGSGTIPVLSITSPTSPVSHNTIATTSTSSNTVNNTITALNASTSHDTQTIRTPINNQLDSAIRVVITPSQSSYFAGEPFSVTITFTNMRTPERSPLIKGSGSGHGHGHKRGSHSISSAPLARPPTSPGTPPARGSGLGGASPSVGGVYGFTGVGGPGRGRSGDDGVVRKGLIGKSRKGNGTVLSSPNPNVAANANASTSSSTTTTNTSNPTAGSSSTSPSTNAASSANGNGSTNPSTSPNPNSSSSTGVLSDLKTDALPELIEQRRKRLLAKSLSVSITPHELDEQLGGMGIGEGTLARSATLPPNSISSRGGYPDPRRSPTSPMIPSPLSRSDTLALSSNHPHARKQSLLDGQLPLNDFGSPATSTPSTLPYSHMSSSGGYPNSPSASSSTFSLALDPIAESAHSPYPSTPMIASPSIETPSHPFNPVEHQHLHHQQHHHQEHRQSGNSVYAYPPPRPQHAGSGLRPLQLSSGISALSSSSSAPTSPYHSTPPSHLSIAKSNSSGGQPQPPRSAFSSTFPQPNAELILYSYVQLTGTLSLSTVPGSMPTAEQVQTMNAVRGALLKKSVVGGGSMDITSSLNTGSSSIAGTGGPGGLGSGQLGHGHGGGAKRPPHRRTHTRSSSFSAGLLALLGGSGTSAPPSSSGSAGTLNTSASWSSGPQRLRAASGGANSSILGKGAVGGGSRIVNAGDGVGLGLNGGGGGVVGVDEEIDPDVPLPTFEVQPSMLAVDLALLPGESRSFGNANE